MLTLLLCVPRTFAYDSLLITLNFFNIFNPRHVSHRYSPTTRHYINFSTPLVLHYYPIRFSSKLPLFPTHSKKFPIPGLTVPPNNITWLSFDSVIYSLDLNWNYGLVVSFRVIYLKQAIWIFVLHHISILVLLFSSLPFNYFFHHLHRLHYWTNLVIIYIVKLIYIKDVG